MTGTLDQRLSEVAAVAIKIEAETGCPAQEIIAQWATESQWGAKPCGHANYFGIKRAARHAKFCTVRTREVIHGQSVMQDLEFADYDSLEDSCRDFAWLITHGSPYASAWAGYERTKDVRSLIAGVAHVYATDPNYAKLVTTIAFQSNVQAAIAKARAAA